MRSRSAGSSRAHRGAVVGCGPELPDHLLHAAIGDRLVLAGNRPPAGEEQAVAVRIGRPRSLCILPQSAGGLLLCWWHVFRDRSPVSAGGRSFGADATLHP